MRRAGSSRTAAREKETEWPIQALRGAEGSHANESRDSSGGTTAPMLGPAGRGAGVGQLQNELARSTKCKPFCSSRPLGPNLTFRK